jgi:hypothetical protein
VLISNPERKKERTDANADSREVYVAGLSKFAVKEDLEKIFKMVSRQDAPGLAFFLLTPHPACCH